MSAPNLPHSGQPKRIPRWLAYVLFAIVWGGVPWAVSLLSPRYGWAAGRPSFWNLLGLIPLVAGIAGSLWTLLLHFAESREGLDWEEDKSYLLTRGPYAFSRNPMYLSELTLLLGWVLFYGSVAVWLAFVFWWAAFSFYLVPREERTIEARFGEAYRAYQARVPRWLGKTQL